MPTFSQRSLGQLATCDQRLQSIAHAAIKIMDFVVVEGHRDKQGQDMAIVKGTTKVHWPHGKHNSSPSKAMDVMPYPIDLSNDPKALERFVLLQGILFAVAHSLGIKVRLGIDWDGDLDTRDEKGLRDYPHIELLEV